MKSNPFFIAAALTIGIVSAPASAVIVMGNLTGGNYFDLGGSFVVTNAAATPNVRFDAFNQTNVFGLNERQAVALTSGTRFWHTGALSAGPSFTDIGVGRKVSSHLIFIDPAQVPDPAIVSGTVTFSGKILGYRWSRAELNGTSALLGSGSIAYGDLLQLERANDEITFSGNTLNYSFVSRADSGDFVRVITAVPEPASWAMLIAGFSLVGISARRRQRTVAA